MSILPGGENLSMTSCEKIIGVWDIDRIEQVFINLISNALKYGLGKPITVEVCLKDNHAFITALDHGIGIDQKSQSIIFEKFQRLNIETNDISGLGIGLYITKEIVNAHKGHISVESTPGQGSRFEVMLPLG